MKEVMSNSLYFGISVTLLGYFAGLFLSRKLKLKILNPMLVSIVLTIITLLAFDVKYSDYIQSGKYISYLLTPATVCLAIPLYEKIDLLKKNLKAITAGILAGVFTSLFSVLALSILFSLPHEIYASILPKSITTAIGIAISEEIGGMQVITVAVIIVTGIFGNVAGEGICRLLRIRNPISVGLSFGTAAHALGTSKALEIGEAEGAMSGLSIAISGFITAILAPMFVNFL